MITCNCPADTALPSIGTHDCAVSFGQIQKVAFVRLKANGARNNFLVPSTSETGPKINLLASWTQYTTATDGTKILVSPYIQAPTEDGGDAITFGGGNETLGGQTIVVGRNPVNFSGVFRALPQNYTIKELKKLMCEASNGNLGVYLFDENGRIEGIYDSSKVYPIPIRSLFIGDKIHGGLEAPDSNVISWSYAPNYSDDLEIYTPEFNPLTDL